MPISLILVSPEIPENIGFVARVMRCYNINTLRFVKLKKLSSRSLAYKTGCSATNVLDNAQYFKDIPSAIQDCHLAFGFTRRHRITKDKRVSSMEEVLCSTSFLNNVALVFGCESQGLSQEDCQWMNKLLFVKLPNTKSSLNLSHCVNIVLHEIFCHTLISNNPIIENKSSTTPIHQAIKDTTIGDRQADFQTFLSILKSKNVLKKEKQEAHIKYCQDLWNRTCPNKDEMEFLIGLIHKLTK